MSQPEILGPEPTPAAMDRAVKLTHILYGLQAAAFFFGITAIVALVINYLKQEDVRGTWLESHFTWQRRTFWIGLAWGIVGFLLMFVMIGMPLLFALVVWLIYRVAKGWLALSDGRVVVPARF